VPREGTEVPATATTFDQDRGVKDYMDRVQMYDVSATTERQRTVNVATITYAPKPKQ
jgi:hypothetical protein